MDTAHHPPPSRLAAIAAQLLDERHRLELADYLTQRRANRITYHEIAGELVNLTAGAVVVTAETVRRWHAHYETAAVPA